MDKFQVVLTDSQGRSWDSIRPTVSEAFNRVGQFLTLEDDSRLIRLGDMIISCDAEWSRAVGIAGQNGFSVKIKTIKVA